METTTRHLTRSIDVTGLPEEAIRAVESLVSLLRGLPPSTQTGPASADEWARQFDDWMREVAARAGQYPPGIVVADGRESIYEGRGE
jgi:hypothetical protein